MLKSTDQYLNLKIRIIYRRERLFLLHLHVRELYESNAYSMPASLKNAMAISGSTIDIMTFST